jgi:tetratricopeptide (TPR) repeat protein
VPPLEKALLLKRNDAATAYNLALVLHLSSQTDAAMAVLEKLPPDGDSLNLLGEIYAEKDKLPQAIATLRKATEIAPKDERNYIDLATLCIDHQSTDLGIEIATIGLKNIPNSARLYALRGAIYAQAGNSDAAAADFDKSSALEPDKLYGSVGVSLLLRESAKLPEAGAIIRKKLTSAPNDPILNYLMADILIREGAEPGRPEFREAVEFLNKSIKMKPDFVDAHAALSKLYMKSGKVIEAIAQTERTLELAPADHIALNQLTLAYRKLGRNEEAEHAAKRLRALLAEEEKQEVTRNRVRLRAADR